MLRYTTVNTANTANTISVITSWVIFNLKPLMLHRYRILLAGTIMLCSKNAIHSLMSIAFQSDNPLSFKSSYQANVIKIFEAINKPIVRKFISDNYFP